MNDFSEAKKYISGGVNSPVRAFKSLGRDPVFIERGKGKYLFDNQGHMYLDFCLSWGAMILGHAREEIVEEVIKTVKRGTSYGAPTRLETELAKRVCHCFPSMERTRLVNSGTEAVMTAVRLARAFTGRDKILKFDGCYHGHSDGLLVSAGSGVSGLPSASSGGIPSDFVRHTISIPFNDKELLQEIFDRYGNSLAAVVLEPVPANMGLVLPEDGFLQLIRELTLRHSAVLVFDEVITGFRVGLGGAQERFGIRPDLTCLGKIIGGGFPVGAVGGRKDIMEQLAPEGSVYQAGTLSGNPVAMRSGVATLDYLASHKELYSTCEEAVKRFADKWRKRSKLTVNALSSMFTVFHTEKTVKNFIDSRQQNEASFRDWFCSLLEKGIYMPPSMFETAFVSVDHTEDDLDLLLDSV